VIGFDRKPTPSRDRKLNFPSSIPPLGACNSSVMVLTIRARLAGIGPVGWLLLEPEDLAVLGGKAVHHLGVLLF
jgi:hypothetical protein